MQALAPNGALLTHDYYNTEIKVVDQELALGGLRLARVLNNILTSPEPAAAQTSLTPPAATTPSATPAPHM